MAGPAFLAGGGETGARMRAFDWSATPVGDPATWPPALRIAVGLVLASPESMYLAWGPELTFFHNDAYRPILGPRLAQSIGNSLPALWPDAWPAVRPLVERTFAGDSCRFDDMPIMMARQGADETTWWSFSYSPVRDENGAVAGLFCITNETTDRVQSAAALRASETRNRQIIDSALDFAIIATDRDGRVTRWSEGARRVLGWSEAEMLGQSAARFFTPEDVAGGQFEAEMHKALRFGRAKDERWHQRACGERFWAVGELSVLRDERQDAIGFVKILRDRTQQREAAEAGRRNEARLRDSEARLSLALRAAQLGTFDWNVTTNAVVLDEQSRAIFGFAVEEGCHAQEIFDRIHPEDRAAITAEAEQAIADGRRIETDYRIVLPDGEIRTVTSIGNAVSGSDGRTGQMFGVFGDVTQRRAGERALRELNRMLARQVVERTRERDLLATIVETTDVMILVSDLDYNILAINQANADEFERIYGVRPQVGDNMLALLADQPEHQEQVRIGWGRGLAGEEFTFVEDFGDPDRVRPYFEVKFRTLRDQHGMRIGAYQFVTDVTERLHEQAKLAQAQEAVRQSQKMEAVGQLTGGVAHDFNNLLTIIRSSVDLLRRPDLAEERRKRYIDAVSDTVDRAAKLTGQLLAFARRQALKPEVFEVGARLRAVADMLDTVTGSRIRVVTDLPARTCFVRADVSQFETALVNMAVNARDAMDGDGVLTIRLRHGAAMPPLRGHAGNAGPFAAVSMIDTGSGIPPDRITRIFDPFFTTKDVGKGTGLGLSQVFGFAKQSGGDVAVESVVGEGARFTLYLPETEAAVMRDSPDEESRPATGEGRRVLVVEDNVEVGRFSTKVLQDLGYDTTWAANAEEALERIGATGADFDVVFSDVVMPGMGGIALAEDLRRRLPHIPVVLASGYSHVLATDDTHGFELLHKPYSAEQLSHTLQRVINRRGVAEG